MNTQTSAPLISGFKPFIPPDCRILLLGSMPSVASLEQGFYYAHKSNRFWPVISTLAAVELKSLEDKKSALTKLEIGLYDVIKRCRREGSLDHKIKEIEPSDLRALIATLPKLERIITNGSLASKLFQRYFADLKTELEVIHLPSTSPANAKMSLEMLTELYRKALSL